VKVLEFLTLLYKGWTIRKVMGVGAKPKIYSRKKIGKKTSSQA
jgi:uncharacterized protein VirK/YbjX